MLMLPNFQENRLTDGGKFVSRIRRTSFTGRMIPGNNYCKRLSKFQGPVVKARIASTAK
jgi:hypothetical protein